MQLNDDMMAFGDLDADGINDAAVILISSGGGSGTFYDVVAVIDRNGKPYPVATANLGDRIKVNSLIIKDGQIVVELTEPLPEPDAGNLSQPWLIELADGTICGLMIGTIPGVDDRVAPYGCQNGTNLFEDFQQDGDVWMAEQAVFGLNDNGFFVEESEMVPIRTIWR